MRILTRFLAGATLLFLALPAPAAEQNDILLGDAYFEGGQYLGITLKEHPLGNGKANYSWTVDYRGFGFEIKHKTGNSCGQDYSGKTNPSYQGGKSCTVNGQVDNSPNISGLPLCFQVTYQMPGIFNVPGRAFITIYQKTNIPGVRNVLLNVVANCVPPPAGQTVSGITVGYGIQPGGGL